MGTKTVFSLAIAGAVLLSLAGFYLWRSSLPSTVEEGEGQTLGAAAESRPDFLTADVPVYAGALLLSQSQTRAGQQATWAADRSLGVVKKYYQEKLSQNGWLDNGAGIYTKDGRRLELSLIEQDPQKTIILLSLTL